MSGIELLAPARDLECGLAAIDCGADAVYIGAPRFGARAAAGNSLAAIEALARHAHRYWARVYVTLNTLLFDHELEEAARLAWQCREIGADGLIIQDPGLLECELPPLPLIASTQMHNHTPERVAFLERVGFERAILARELTIEEIRAIRRAAPRIELECFVHGALCVCYSGQCRLSYALGGRSGNRGECAQPCRRAYTLVDGAGRVVAPEGHLLSLRDLNLSNHLAELIEAGVTCFKIEGRLKDRIYVANVVAHYRARLDALGVSRGSSGKSTVEFTPDPAKTFNRGFTTCFLRGRGAPIASPETPKMVGERIGRVVRLGETVGRVAGRDAASFTLDTEALLHAGDGLCFFDGEGRLRGTNVNAANGRAIVPDKMDGIGAGTLIHRNHDHEFLSAVARSRNQRRISVTITVGGGLLEAVDEDGNRAEVQLPAAAELARDPERARQQLAKTGDTEFVAAGVRMESAPFLPVSAWNALRREALERLRAARERSRPRREARLDPNDAPFPEPAVEVLNHKAEAFYRRHGVARVEPAPESGLDLAGRRVMTTRYCLKEQLGLCGQETGTLALLDDQNRRLELEFDCTRCQMQICAAR
jgi:collagenase-like PrtC family protease